MKKVFVLIGLFFIFLFGLTIGGNFNKGASQIFEESKNQFENEKMYQITMNNASYMLKIGVITKDEYFEIDTIFLKKYTICTKNSLYFAVSFGKISVIFT